MRVLRLTMIGISTLLVLLSGVVWYQGASVVDYVVGQSVGLHFQGHRLYYTQVGSSVGCEQSVSAFRYCTVDFTARKNARQCQWGLGPRFTRLVFFSSALQKLGVHVKIAMAAAAGVPSPHSFHSEIAALEVTLGVLGSSNRAVVSGLQGASAPSTPALVCS
jgi:hypothetical protein